MAPGMAPGMVPGMAPGMETAQAPGIPGMEAAPGIPGMEAAPAPGPVPTEEGGGSLMENNTMNLQENILRQ